LRMRGGEGIFDDIDKMGQSIMGNGLWKFVKLAIGWREKVQHTVEEDLEICRKITSRHVKKSNMVDRKLLYFISQGPTFFANPVTYLLRYMRGTEVQVAKAVSFLNENKDKLSTNEMKEHLSKAESKGGLGLTPARVSEALFRASIQVEEQQEEEDNKKHFVEEEDEELAAYQKKLEKSHKGTSSAGENKKIHKLATQKWTGTSGNVVKRLQKELIAIQSSGSFEVELVNDNIFEWYVTIEGAKGSFYEGEKFKLRFGFDEKYPTEPPEVTFVVQVPGWPLPEAPTTCASGDCPSQRKGGEWPARWGTRKHHCPIHPHIYTNGHICLSIIYDDWSPALGVEAVCHSMISMMSSAKEKEPPADNEMHLDAGQSGSAKKLKGWDFHDHEA